MFFFIKATYSFCFELLMIVLFLFILCVYDDELYFLFENLHYHLNDFVTLIWYMAMTLILSYVLFLRRILAQTPLEPRTGYNHQHCLCIMSRILGSGTHGTWHPKCLILSQRILLLEFESGIHDKLWYRGKPSCSH